MRRSFLIVGIATLAAGGAAAAAGPSNTLTPAERAAGWTLLFDGSSTDAWRSYQDKRFPEKGWRIDGDALRVVEGGGGGDIITKAQYGNFELALEWKVAEKANSGIMYRVVEDGGAATWNSGPEFQILDDASHGMGPTDWHSAGALYALKEPAAGKVSRPAGAWNQARIRLVDGRVEHWLNGRLVLEDDLDGEDFKQRVAASKFAAYPKFGSSPRGHVALQDHGNDVWFRNIRIRDLDAPLPGEIALFNGQDLSGWTGHFQDGAAPSSVFRVEDGLLVDSGRPIGYLRTEDTFTNFVLMLQWRWNPDTKVTGNGGVLFRMTGPDKVWPRSIEAQLHAGNAGDFWNIDEFDMQVDPERTSGRRTRKTALAENPVGQWNRYEIICDGGDVVLKVNGREVNRAWDAAEIAGHICLQAEGAEMHFRDLRLAPIQ